MLEFRVAVVEHFPVDPPQDELLRADAEGLGHVARLGPFIGRSDAKRLLKPIGIDLKREFERPEQVGRLKDGLKVQGRERPPRQIRKAPIPKSHQGQAAVSDRPPFQEGAGNLIETVEFQTESQRRSSRVFVEWTSSLSSPAFSEAYSSIDCQ